MAYAPTLERLRTMAKFWSYGGDTSYGGGEDALRSIYDVMRCLELDTEMLLG